MKATIIKTISTSATLAIASTRPMPQTTQLALADTDSDNYAS
ncbi:hypothetical protein ACLUXI_02885 [Bifidobacterium apri]|nr:hypothetical protein [Bifidobacterium thermophilum]MDC7285069.1 hypothetical protein [Bifidobacterium thermophilum]